MSSVPRQRKAAVPQVSKIVKASVSVRTDLNSRWAAAAALSGITKNAFAVNALTTSLKGIHIIDRRKNSGLANPIDRPDGADGENLADENDE